MQGTPVYRRLWSFIRSKPGRAAVGLSVLLAIANAVLIASALSRRSSAAELAIEVENLEASLSQLRQVEQEGLQELGAEALSVEADLDELKAAFPTLGDAFDMYRRAFALAHESAVEITSIETGSSTIEQTPVGYLSKTAYTVKALGGFADCIELMARLETAGLQTLALDQLQLDPLHCEFNVVLASSVPPSEIDQVGDG